MYQIGNIYVIAAIAIMGGGLFGFDISAMSAMSVNRNGLPESRIIGLILWQHSWTSVQMLFQPSTFL